jgi:hypothetical protein
VNVDFDDLEQYLSIPYTAVFYSIEREDGVWVRRGEYPELGCVSEGQSQLDVMERLEDERVRAIAAIRSNGDEPPMPRPPLTSGASGLSELPVHQLYERAMRVSS